MKNFFSRGCVLLVVLTSGCGGHATPASSTAQKDAPVRLVGRFDAAHRFAWSGAAIEVRFRGTALAMHLDVPAPKGDGRKPETSLPYAVFRDGKRGADVLVSAGTTRYLVADGLDPAAEHVVRVVRESEARAGVHTFLGVELPRGGELLAPRPRSRQIEVVGDSIACGYGVLGASEKCGFSYATERATAAWPYLLGDAVDADVTVVCWSGKGVYRNYDGTTEATMLDLAGRTLPEVPITQGVAKRDVVIVALGTNDFLSPSAVPADVGRFEARYATFLGALAEAHPEAAIAVASSPMVPPGDGLREREIAAVGAAFARAKDRLPARSTFVPLPHQETRRGCDYHPNAEMHRILANAIAMRLRSDGLL